MIKYQVSAFYFEWYDGSRILECRAFTINPLESFSEIADWVSSLPERPDHIRINVRQCGCLFDNEDTRILNNTFFCTKYE